MNELQQFTPKQFPKIWAIVIAVVLTVIIVGGGVYVWQRALLNDLEQHIVQLQNQVAELQEPSETKKAEEAEEPTPAESFETKIVGSFSFKCFSGSVFCPLQNGRLIEEIAVMRQLRTTEDQIARDVYDKTVFQEVEEMAKRVERKTINKNSIIVVELVESVDYFVYDPTDENRVLHFRGLIQDKSALDVIVQTITYSPPRAIGD